MVTRFIYIEVFLLMKRDINKLEFNCLKGKHILQKELVSFWWQKLKVEFFSESWEFKNNLNSKTPGCLCHSPICQKRGWAKDGVFLGSCQIQITCFSPFLLRARVWNRPNILYHGHKGSPWIPIGRITSNTIWNSVLNSTYLRVTLWLPRRKSNSFR